ncbi:MAG: type I-E CRISPR-associated protein Cas5/CasD [Corynebacterium sp.]|nr:type I-E CRISPR-associated protein Cas5/CasD [Corynebacterium sp.]
MSAHSLLLLLKGPMQAWGYDSRYTTRATHSMPTKSGVLGLLAAAQGRRRTDPLEDLVKLSFAVRIDQPGTLLRDFQTAAQWQMHPGEAGKLVNRYYLADAAFLVAIEAPERELLEGLADALNHPKYPLFLGRRSCPVSVDLVQGIVDKPAVDALRDHSTWHATKTHKRERSAMVSLPIYRDAQPGEEGTRIQDIPVSFSPEHRKYQWRTVIEDTPLDIANHDSQVNDDFIEAVMSA